MCKHCSERLYRLTQGHRLSRNPLLCALVRAWETFANPILGFARNFKKAIIITAEMVVPESIKRKTASLEASYTPDKRWKDIVSICAQIMAETKGKTHEA